MKHRLEENLKRVHERIEAAASRCGRSPRGVSLVAVTKYVGLDVIQALMDLGVEDLGESRPQELMRRATAMREYLEQNTGARELNAVAPRLLSPTVPRWHQIGPLQRNKAAKVLPFVHLIHSVDTLRLAEEIDAASARIHRRTPILLEVNATGEAQKHGVSVPACLYLAEVLSSLRHVRLCGLMAMGPNTTDETLIRRTFERVGELFQEIRRQRFATEDFRILSMGMSHDFELAIAAGATMVRVGSALFEGVLPADHDAAAPPVEDETELDGSDASSGAGDAASDGPPPVITAGQATESNPSAAVSSRKAERTTE